MKMKICGTLISKLNANKTDKEKVHHMKLHTCDEILPNGPPVSDMKQDGRVNWSLQVDNDCLTAISKLYVVSSHLSSFGSHGSVLRLDEPGNYQRQIAVKLIPYEIDPKQQYYVPGIVMRDAQRELYVACQLNNIANETQVFTKTLGWLVSDFIPETWKRYIKHKEYADVEKRSHLFIFMESNPFTLLSESLVFYEADYTLIIFLLFHAIYIARRELGFKHNELHDRNFMFASSLSQTPSMQIELEVQRFEVVLPLGHFPKIIDYGLSATSEANDGVRQRRNDLYFIMQSLQKRAEKREETVPNIPGMESLINQTENGEYEPIARFLLENEAFESIRNTSKRQKMDPICFFCGSHATLQWNNNDQRAFCTHGCGLKLNQIAVFL